MNKRKLFSLLLIVVGIAIMSYSLIMPKVIAMNYNHAMKQSGEELKENLKKQQEKAEKEDLFDFSKVASINELTPMTKIVSENVIGGLYIPDVAIKMPIMYGATHENMLNGVGTMKKDMQMGENNYSLAGHNHPNPKLMLAPLKKMEIDDKIYITDKDKVYEYVTSSIEVVMPDRVDVIDDVEGKKEITLVSCYSDDGHDRIIVKGELSNVIPYTEANQELLKAFNAF